MSWLNFFESEDRTYQVGPGRTPEERILLEKEKQADALTAANRRSKGNALFVPRLAATLSVADMELYALTGREDVFVDHVREFLDSTINSNHITPDRPLLFACGLVVAGASLLVLK